MKNIKLKKILTEDIKENPSILLNKFEIEYCKNSIFLFYYYKIDDNKIYYFFKKIKDVYSFHKNNGFSFVNLDYIEDCFSDKKQERLYF